MVRFWSALLWVGFMLGCNGLFYYPDDVVYTDPTLADQVVEPFTVRGSTGETLSGWYLPTKWQRQGLILHFHGNAQNMTAHVLFTFWLVDAGYDLVVFDYRGYGNSSGSPARAGMVTDAKDMLNHVQQKFAKPGEDFVVLAQSLGGAIAIPALATWEQGHADMIVLDSTFATYRSIARDKLSNFWLTWPLQWPLSLLVSDDYSPIDYAKSIDTPLLMLHGTKDDITPLGDAKNLYDRFSSKDKKLWIIPGGYHTSAFQEGSPYLAKLLDHLCVKSKNPELCQANRKLFPQRYEERKSRSMEEK